MLCDFSWHCVSFIFRSFYSAEINKWRLYHQWQLHSFAERPIRCRWHEHILPSFRWQCKGNSSAQAKRRRHRMDNERRSTLWADLSDGELIASLSSICSSHTYCFMRPNLNWNFTSLPRRFSHNKLIPASSTSICCHCRSPAPTRRVKSTILHRPRIICPGITSWKRPTLTKRHPQPPDVRSESTHGSW